MHLKAHGRLMGGVAVCCVALAATVAAGKANAQAEVRLMHVERNPVTLERWDQIAQDYEAANPGVNVELEFLENESFKAKLPTLLQSEQAPDLFYSWTGGVLEAQQEAGALENLTEEMQADDGAWANTYKPAALERATIDGDVYCVPYKMNVVGFFYNRPLFEEAGIDAENIKTWDDFIAAVETLKEAGITPIAGGGGEKWPLHFYWSYLALRIGGAEAFQQAKAGENGGFTAEPFVEAFEKVRELGELEPFQPGYLGARWQDTLSLFSDGRAAMILSFDDTYSRQQGAAADGVGLAREDMGIFSFPVVEGGAGTSSETFGGVNCWAVTRDAAPEAIDFAKYLTSAEVQADLAAAGVLIPAAQGADDSIADPFVQAFARELGESDFHQIYLDQDLGPSAGRTVNDVTVEVFSGSMEPEEAAQQVQEAYELDQ